ncbi:MAG: BspA family leucine-rich repeat surface protein [Roseburia sp.]|nr:BspA family leucine-rich repeat surface protein [Roseburia sp.]
MRTKNIAMILTMALTAGLCQTAAPSQAATPKLSAKKLTMKVGKTAALKVKKTSKKAKWSIVSGKKNIRLTAKKKTSVKVKAVKAGKAKISCKIGKKKLICKVTSVAPTQSPTVTASATPTATVAPTSTPTQTPGYEIKTKNTPGPVAEYDCLQVDPIEYKSYFDLQQGGAGVLWCEEMKFFGTNIWRNEIEQIRIVKSKEVPENVIGSFDLSEKKNGSVMGWYTDEDNDGKYEVCIGQDGGVVANANSAYLFSDIVNIEDNEKFIDGIENLDTSHVTNMQYMFYFSHDNTTVFDLGDNFDTSKVKDISYMFYEMAYPRLEKIRWGKKFDPTAIEKQTGAFQYIEKGDNTYCYVKDQKTKEWFTEHAEEMSWHIGYYGDWTYRPENDNYVVVES